MAKRNVVDFRIVNIPDDDAFKQLKKQGKVDPNAMYVSPDTSLKEKHITNCITEIPQDIKLELNNGTLTLKAGSKVYMPNGAGVFDSVPITDDLVMPSVAGTRQVVVYVLAGGTSLNWQTVGTLSSGATDSLAGTEWHLWYDTSNNIINRYGDSGAFLSSGHCFPIALCTVTSGVITSIDQVFNGFGYIGSNVFTLPGVKGLYPNGRNEDGTLKNGIVECTTVQVSSVFTGTVQLCLFLRTDGRCQWYGRQNFYYNEETNTIHNSQNGVTLYAMDAGTFDVTSGVISNFNPKTAFRAVDYSEYLQTKKSLDNKVSELNSSILSTKTELSNSISSTKTELNSSISSVDSSAVHKTGNETIAGIKTFEASPIVPTPAANSNSTNAATTAWVRTHTSNVVRLVAEQKATSANNYTWYRKYSDGWVEQGGRQNIGGNSTVTFPIAMADKDSYDLQLTVIDKYRFACVSSIDRRTATSIGVSTGDDSTANDDGTINWNVCGYAAS